MKRDDEEMLTRGLKALAAEMESLIADLLAKCYYHQAHHHQEHHAAPAESAQQMESYAPPASLEEEPTA